MAASAYIYTNWLKAAQSGANLASSPSLKATLHTSSYVPNLSSHTVYASLTNELPTNYGYTVGGATLSGVTFNVDGSTVPLKASPTIWTANTSNLVARYLVLRYFGTVNGQVDPLILYVLMDNSPADVTATPGNAITVNWSTSGIYITSKV